MSKSIFTIGVLTLERSKVELVMLEVSSCSTMHTDAIVSTILSCLFNIEDDTENV